MGKIYIIRHGQTDLNKQKIMQGRIDSVLNEEGRSQAERAAKLFKESGIHFDQVYSSPLRRAVETARIVAREDTEVLYDDRLLEMDYGPYDGSSLENPPKELAWFFQDFVHHTPPEGMETLAHVVERTGAFLMDLRDQAGDRNILISTHAITMKGFLEYLNPERDGSFWGKYIGNCSVYWTELRDGAYTVSQEYI